MTNDSPQKAILVVLAVALVCSVMVSIAAVSLRPIQLAHKLLERAQHVVQLTGLAPADSAALAEEELLTLYGQLDARVIDIDNRDFDPDINPDTFDQRRAANDPERSKAIPTEYDVARLGRRSRFATVYLMWEGDQLQCMVLPVHGQGMWSTMYGYIALDADLNTIASVAFYEQGETPGLGDQILRPNWQAQWQGRRILDEAGETRFRIAPGSVQKGSSAALHEVDALSGATVTANGVTAIVSYWFGAHGFQPFLAQLREAPPARLGPKADNGE